MNRDYEMKDTLKKKEKMNDITQRITELPPEKRQLLIERLKKKHGVSPEQRIPRQPRESNVFPLSFAQERLWFLEQIEPGTSVYNFPFAFGLRGHLNVTALEQALNEIVKRHEVLRTTFATLEGQPVQIIAEDFNLTLPVADLSGLSEAENNKEIRRLIDTDAQTPFDLSKGPLWRATLIRRSDVSHALMICIHHSITDGWSKDVFHKELLALYNAFSSGQPSPLPELPIQYADYAIWQREWLQGDVLEHHLSYWKLQLAGAPPILELPTDRPRPTLQTFPGGYETFTLSSSVSEAVTALSKREGATLFMTMLAALQILLHRYTAQKDIVVGSPVAGRDRPEVEGLIGFFVNNLVLRTNMSGNPSFRELLSRVRKVVLDACAHQDIPFEKLVEELEVERNLTTTPLFQVMFIMLNASPPSHKLEQPDQKVGPPILQNNMTSKFDLTLYLEEAEELIGTFEYNTDLFDASTIKRMAGHFLCLLEGIVNDPEQRLSELPILTQGERQQLLVQWNATEMEYPRELCFPHLFETQAAKSPDVVALVFENQRLTYGELNSRANQLARYLRKLGVGPDSLVGICTERSLEMMIGLLAVLKAGGAYVPLDPSYPEERLDYMLSDSGAKVLLTQESLIEDFQFSVSDLNKVCLDRDWNQISEESESNPESEINAANLAYVIYTSGSTGKPKGVAVQHANLMNFLTSMREGPGLSSDDALVAVTTLSFDISVLELYLPLTVGARVVLTSREEAGDGRRLGEILTDSGATVMQATPATWRMLLDTGWSGSNQLKMLCGGEALPRELANELFEKGASLWNMYGPTETTIWSAVLKIEDTDGPVHIGPPIGNTQIYILDSHLQPVPIGVYGELYIGGEGLARGYLNHPALTAERFIPDPFSEDSGVRLYRTGDLARYLPDGKIEFSGRIDHQVKIRGFRIELEEIEAVCVEHPAIQEAVVMAREVAKGDMRLVAYIKYDTHDEPTVSELRQYMKEKLPDYMVPSLFVTMDTFPLTPNGKIDRKILPIPVGMRGETGKAHEPPNSEMEKVIAGVWQQVLGMNDFSVNDNFFDIGGHSLLSMKVLYHIEKELGLRINPREIMFKNLGQLAAFCEKELQRTQKSRSKGSLLKRIKQAVHL